MESLLPPKFLSSSRLQVWTLIASLLFGLGGTFDLFAREPASVEEVVSLLDFAVFPIYGENPEVVYRVAAGQKYFARGSAEKIAGEIVAELKKRGWSEEEGGMLSEAFTSIVFTNFEFVVSLSVTPKVDGSGVAVTLKNHGNIDFKKLPLPSDWQNVQTSTMMATFHTAEPIEQSLDRLRAVMLVNGWEDFGSSKATHSYRKNAVKLQFSASVAPAFWGTTVIQATAEQLSCVIPLPPKPTLVQYDDGTGKFVVESEENIDSLTEFFRGRLLATGWIERSPTESNTPDRSAFINSIGDVLEFDIQRKEQASRIDGVFKPVVRSSQIVAIAKEPEVPMVAPAAPIELPVLVMELPKYLKVEVATENSVEITTVTRGAVKAVKLIQEKLEAAGWQTTPGKADRDAGATVFKKAEQELRVEYSDPGLKRAKISMKLSAGKLKVESE